MFDLLKRDGRWEEYDRAKLARSLVRAGVAPYMLAGILDTVAPNPGQDTGSLRADVESELRCWHPTAARRYSTTRSLTVHGSDQTGYGWVCVNPETVSLLSLRPGDAVWLSDSDAPAPFSIESHQEVERGQVWLNPREMAAMGVTDGAKLTAASAYHSTPAPFEEPQDNDRADVTRRSLSGTAGLR